MAQAVTADTLTSGTRPLAPADLVVGIPTYNHADPVGSVVSAVRTALSAGQRTRPGLIAIIDGGSTDATTDRAREAAGDAPFTVVRYPCHAALNPAGLYGGVPLKGCAMHALFDVAATVGAKACVVIGREHGERSGSTALALAEPVLATGTDLAVGWHARGRYDGLLNLGITYPVTRAVFGHRLREPLAVEAAFSRPFVDHCLAHPHWESAETQHAFDLWAPVEAVIGNFAVTQVMLGPHTSHTVDLTDAVVQIVGSLFGAVTSHAGMWQRVRGSRPVPVVGTPLPPPPDDGQVDTVPLIDAWRLGLTQLQGVWGLVLPPATLVELKRLSRAAPQDFRLADRLWARLVYDFALAYRLRVIAREQLLRALTPLYLGWAASFLGEIRDRDPATIETRVEALCKTFEAEKPYLISRWRWPDRFNP